MQGCGLDLCELLVQVSEICRSASILLRRRAGIGCVKGEISMELSCTRVSGV